MNNTISLWRRLRLYLKYPRTGNRLLDDIWRSPRDKSVAFPRLLIVYLTELCNLNCPFCLNRQIRNQMQRPSKPFLSVEMAQKIAREAKKSAAMVYLIGGEPLLHPQFEEIVRIFRRARVLLSTTTNGVLLSRYAQLIAHNFDFVSVSLDYPDASRHDRARRRSGTFKRATDGIRELVAARGRKLLPNIKINTVVLKDNVKDLAIMYQLADKLGVDEFSLEHFSFKTPQAENQAALYQKRYSIVGHYVDGSPVETSPFDQSDINELRRQINKIQELSKTSRVKFTLVPDIDDFDRYYSDVMPSAHSFCFQPFAEFNIRANGDLQMCQGITLGNLANTTINRAWQSKRANQFRNHLRQVGITPACYRCCALTFRFK